jgi:hypothetical protein
VVADAGRKVFHANDAFLALARCSRAQCADLDALLSRFVDPEHAHQVIGQLQAERRPWRGELMLKLGARDGALAATLPVAVRAEPVPARDGTLLGLIFIFEDLSESRRADAARRQLETSLSQAGRQIGGQAARRRSDAADELVSAILSNASLAAMDVGEGGSEQAPAGQLAHLEAATRRATSLYGRIRQFAVDPEAEAAGSPPP